MRLAGATIENRGLRDPIVVLAQGLERGQSFAELVQRNRSLPRPVALRLRASSVRSALHQELPALAAQCARHQLVLELRVANSARLRSRAQAPPSPGP